MRSLFTLTIMLAIATLQISCEKQGKAALDTAGAGGSLARFAIVGNYLYIVDPHALAIYQLTDPANPKFIVQEQIGFDIETIFPYKNKLYLGASNGMYIYSVDDPEKPVRESAITHFRACDPVVSNDSVAYVTLRGGSTCGSLKNVLNVYDLKDINHPLLAREIELTSPYGLGISGQALYVCEGSHGIRVFDLQDPYKPVLETTITTDSCYDVIPYNDVLIAYVEKGISFFDISDPLHPLPLSTVKN